VYHTVQILQVIRNTIFYSCKHLFKYTYTKQA